MAEPIRIARGILVPESAVEWRAVRSSGPGGQNVNKVASKVELRVTLEAVTGLGDAARARLRALAAGRLDGDGRLLLTSQRTRDQLRNLEDVQEKVKKLVERAKIIAPRARRKLTPRRQPGGAVPAERLRPEDEERQRRQSGRAKAVHP